MAGGGREMGGIQIGEARKGMHMSRHLFSLGSENRLHALLGSCRESQNLPWLAKMGMKPQRRQEQKQ